MASKMDVITMSETGDADVLQFSTSALVPSLEDGQVLIQNSYAGVNFLDVYFRKGIYPNRGGFPFIPGQEGVGTVVKTKGDVLGFKDGDLVVWLGSSGYAQYVAVPADRVLRIPDGLSEIDAVGGFTMGITALSLVQKAYPVAKGDVVLVHAAAGGVGLFVCQLLRNIGATVIGTAGGPLKCKFAAENGATHTIDYHQYADLSWTERVMDITFQQGVNCVFDSVGKDTFTGSLSVVRRNGKVVFYGNASGPIPPIDLNLLASKNISVMRSSVLNYIVTRQEFEHFGYGILSKIKEGEVKVNIFKTYALKDAAQAHKDLEGRKTTGKLLLKI